MTRIEKIKNELSKSAVTYGYVAHIDLLMQRYGDEYIELSESILHMLQKMDIDILKVAKKMSINFIKEQLEFQKTGSYGHNDYEQIIKTVYDNKQLMLEEYMPGSFWAYSSASLLYTKYHLFKNKFISRLGNMGNPKKGIEIGVGSGFYIWQLLSNLPEAICTGYDISRYALEFAEKVLEKANIPKDNYKLLLGDIAVLSDPYSKCCDFVIMAEVIEHVPKPQQAIENVSRLLKKDGLLFIATVKDSNHMDHTTNFKSGEEVEGLLTDKGFDVLDRSVNYIKEDFPNINDISVGLAYVCRKNR